MAEIYRLSASLEGHTQDVRGVVFPSSSLVISCSRDGTVRTWKRSSDSKTFEDHINSSSSVFVNSVTWIPDDGGLVVSGSQDTIIDVRPPGGEVDADPKYLLLGHTHNVCALDYYKGVLVSGSWDGKARVWKDGETKLVLEGHEAAVWGVLVLSEDVIVTASGDRTIRIWRNGKSVKTLTAHTDAVRGLCRMPNGGFASCSNDSSIRLWTADGQETAVLYGHTAFIYSVAASPSGELVSSGEDRTVRVWRDNQCVQTITHPAISVWSVAVCPENGDIVSGASDGVVRVFTRSEERLADAETIKKFDNHVQASAIPSNQVGDVNKEKLPGLEALDKPGNKEGQVIMVRNGDTVEAHTWSSATHKWQLIGTVVDAVGSNRKQTYEGKEYDYVFDVDIQEGMPPLKLPFNLKDNPYEAARKFLERNKLNIEYTQTVAEFILKNTKGQTIGTTTEEAADAWGTQNRYRPGQATSSSFSSQAAPPPSTGTRIIPHTKYLTIANISAADLAKAKSKLQEFNAARVSSGDKDAALNPDEFSALDDLFAVLEKCPQTKPKANDPAVAEGLDVLVKILSAWPPQQRIVALDLLRLTAAYSPDVATLKPTGDDDVLDLFEAIDSFNPQFKNNLMLTVRTFVNLFDTDAGRKFMETHSSRVYSLIDKAVQGIDTKPLKTAHITLILNFSILYSTTHNTLQAAGLIDLLTSLLQHETDAEVIYRGLIAVGNSVSLRDATSRVVAKQAGTAEVVCQAARRSGEERARVVVREVCALLEAPFDV